MKSIRNAVPAEFDNQLTGLSSETNNLTFEGSIKDLVKENLPADLSFITLPNQEQIKPLAEGNFRAPRVKKQCSGLW